MHSLIRMRWVLLIVALAGGAMFVLPLLLPDTPLALAAEAGLWAAIVLQPLGVFAMSRHFARGGWPVIVGYLAALTWLIVLLSAQAGVAAGPGGAVYGILITLPALALGLVMQVAALLGFLAKAHKAAR